MSQTTEFTPLTIKAIEAMPYADLMRQAKTIVVNSAYSLVHHTDLLALLDEIDARVKSRP